MIRGSME